MFSNYRLRLRHFVQYDLKHDFPWVADKADRSVVLALLQIAFLGKCDDQGLSPLGWPLSCVPDLVADCHECSEYCFSAYLDQSIPDDFPFFNDSTAAVTSLRRIGWPSFVSIWG